MESPITRQSSHTSTPTKPDVAVAVNEVNVSDSDGSSQYAEAQTITQQSTISRKQTVTRTASFQFTRVVEITRSIRRRIIEELEDVNDHYFDTTDHESYVEFISNERLMHMPSKGSEWDQVLKAAEFFGEQICAFGAHVSHFVPENRYVSNTALSSCWMLLELGHHNAAALNTTFDAFSGFGLLLSQSLQRQEMFDATREIQEDLSDIFASLVNLVGEIAIYYRTRISSMSKRQTVSIDFHSAFGKSIDGIWQKKQHLWNHLWASKLGNKQDAYSIEEIRRNLGPVDKSAEALLFGRLADKAERAQGTCEWIQGHLLNFLRGGEKTLSITGAAGCGKSMLATYMKERLRRTIGRISYETLSHTFASDARSEATPVVFLKSMLSQLLERNVGDLQLYDSLVKAFEGRPTIATLESSLWEAFQVGLRAVQHQKSSLIVIVDGLDEVIGHEAAVHLHKRLHECVSRFDRVRAVTLSKHISHLDLAGCGRLIITPDFNEHDITLYLHETLARHQHFQSQAHAAQHEFVEKLVKKAKGSFLWAYLVSILLGRENSRDSYSKLGHDIHSGVPEILHRLVGHIDLKNGITRHLFEFMLTAHRPLTIGEMEELLSIDLQHHTFVAAVNIRKHIATHCSGLVVIRNGLIRFKHSAIRAFFLNDLCGKALASLATAHTELTQRLLFYVKHNLTVSDEPSYDIPSSYVLKETFGKHLLLEYIVRNWIGHFRSSTLCGHGGEIKLTAGFKDIFPQSPYLGLLEWSCWQRQWSVSETIEHHHLTLQIRKACFGEKHRAVLQTTIIMGSIHRSTSSLVKAAEYFYHASIIGQVVLHKFSTVVVTSTNYFLSCTETIEITKRTEIVTYRETMIRFKIEICKAKHGASSDQVIKWYEVLCKLYIDIKEEHKATALYKELYEIIVVRYGKNHDKTRKISETLGSMSIVLKGGSDEEIKEYDDLIFVASEDMEETDELRISIILRRCQNYERSGNFFLAEKLYINLWRRLSEICRIKATVELHILKINISIEYVRFLQRIKRVEEAQNILLCLWAEFEHHSCEDEILILRIKELGTLFKAFGLLTIAVSIFSKVWGWFKSRGKTTHEEAFATTILITEVVEEIEETTITKKTTTTTTTTVTETVVREIYETHYERCRHSKIDSHFFKASLSLISIYLSQKKWSECEVVIKRSLELTWKAFLTVDAKITLSGTFVKETLLVATQLAICYHHQGYFERAEEIYLRLYRACLSSFAIDHACVTETSLVLIRFYEEYHRHEKVIEIYIELLHGYRKHCGASHHLTIKTLYALGSICLTLGRKEAYEYYIEIVTVLNKDKKHCHHDAFEAAIIICRYYHEEKRWQELHKTCALLWETFVHHHHEFKFTEEMIVTLYERYTYVLEFHVNVEFSVLYKLAVEYRETVTKRFGVSAAIVIKALLALAIICEKHEEHYHESITIYEEIIKRSKTTTTTTTTIEETTIKTVKTRLSKIYVTVITTGKSTSTLTVEKGIAISLEIYEQLKIEYGCWHEKTLTQLRELVILYHKHGKHQSTIIRMLQSVVIETITKVTESITLYHAAATIASIYLSVGLAQSGHDLLHQLHHLIVLRDMASSTEITISIGKVSKVAFVFLIAFEQSLTSKPLLSFSEVMADILLEAYLYEEYTRTIQASTSIEIKLQVGASLHSFWLARSRTTQADILARALFTHFHSAFKSCLHTSSESANYTFFLGLLTTLSHHSDTTRALNFGHLVCQAAESQVAALLSTSSFAAAHDVATAAFHLISHHHYFHARANISHGYRLAALLAGIDSPARSPAAVPSDAQLRNAMLATSRAIANALLAACRDADIDVAELRFADVAGLVRLLGAQANWAELEALLLRLWRSREVHRNWDAETVLRLGKGLVHAHYAAGHVAQASEVADVLCYNLRRSRGWLDPEARGMSRVLAELWTEQKKYAEAMGVHEEVLREIDEDAEGAAEKGVDKKLVGEFLDLLKGDYVRLGGWSKSNHGYNELVQKLSEDYGVKVVPGIEQWSKVSKEQVDKEQIGRYKGIGNGEFRIDINGADQAQKKDKAEGNKSRKSLMKAAKRRSYGFGAGYLQDQIVY
ncbi:MAG: hypothetical protein Q9165_003024 [Trypethelium subeluteriae]